MHLGNWTMSECAVRREHSVILASALERMSLEQREVIILHHLQGCTLAETARRMQMDITTLKNLWVKALGNLRSLLQSENNDWSSEVD